MEGAKDWYTPPRRNERTAKKYLFRVQYVVDPNVVMEDISRKVQPPRTCNTKQVRSLGGKKLPEDSHNKIEHALARRNLLDYEEGNVIDADDGEGEDEEGEWCTLA